MHQGKRNVPVPGGGHAAKQSSEVSPGFPHISGFLKCSLYLGWTKRKLVKDQGLPSEVHKESYKNIPVLFASLPTKENNLHVGKGKMNNGVRKMVLR